ncbi:hypothetical protein VTK26DRAFT_1613 [Humicola hyalothermophila]
MVSRQLRKLRQQQELLNIQNEAAGNSDGSDDEPVVAKPRGNMFSGFAALGDTGADDDDEEDLRSEEETAQKAQEEPPSSRAEPAKKSKKSKKKKKKGKKTESPAQAEEKGESLDEIDKVLEELKLEAQRQGSPSVAPAADDKATNGLNALLSINFHHLKALNEMRRVFGKAMDVAEVEERTQTLRRQTLPQNVDLETFLSARAAFPAQGRTTKARGMFDTILRTNPFIEGKQAWPRGSAQGLKMVRVTKGPQAEVEFAFAHDQEYDALEGSFLGLVQMYDPMQIVYFLHRNPYHVSSLIQVSKVARQDQNSALAADLIERALFTFGRVSLSEFRRNLEKGLARMDFARPENRQFYLAGYNHIQKLVMKGTYRTALEWAKLFLSINHSDPYAMITWIHVLALRAWEAQWLIDFCAAAGLPAATSLYPKQSLPLAHLQLKDPATAKTTLVQNMQSLPWLYCALFSALNLDTPPPLWGIQPRDADETLHTQLYIHTAKDLWNTPQAISLLRDSATSLASRPDASALPPSPRVGLPLARLVYLENVPALMALVPRQMLHAASPNFEFDPLPPQRADNVFSSTTQALPWWIVEQQQQQQQQQRQRQRTGAGAVPGLGPGMGGAGGLEAFRDVALRAFGRMRRELGGGDDGTDEGRERVMAEARRRLEEEGVVPREVLDEWFGAEARAGGEARGGEGGGREGGEEEEGEEQERERELRRAFLGRGEAERESAAPGFVNYLLSLFPRDVDPAARMPGSWEDEEDEEVEDDWGLDEFEGADDFEGEGGGGEEGAGERR